MADGFVSIGAILASKEFLDYLTKEWVEESKKIISDDERW